MTEPGHIPQYRRIAATLADRIESGVYPPSTMLPGEWALASEFGVARPTVRRALSMLTGTGLVERRHGIGSIVRGVRLERRPDRLTSLTDELRARGLEPSTQIIDLSQETPESDIATALRISRRSKVVRVSRLRLANEVVIGMQVTSIPVRFAPDIGKHARDDTSLSRLLRHRYHLRAAQAELTITAVAADERVGAILGCEPGTALLKTSRLSYLSDHRPFERTDGWFLVEHYQYRTWQHGE